MKLFRITENRKQWIQMILAHQDLNINKDIYICDLHFHQNDLIKNGSRISLKPCALPQLK